MNTKISMAMFNNIEKSRDLPMQGFPTELYNELVDRELVPLLDAYELYAKLFAGNTPENVHLMNEVASFFFGNVQMTMLSFIVMGISRLMDAPNKKSLKLLIKNVKENLRTKDDNDNFVETEKLFSVLEKVTEPIVSYRDTHIGHRAKIVGTPPIWKDIEASIKAITYFIKCVGLDYGSITINLDELSFDRKFYGAEAIIKCLQHNRNIKKDKILTVND